MYVLQYHLEGIVSQIVFFSVIVLEKCVAQNNEKLPVNAPVINMNMIITCLTWADGDRFRLLIDVLDSTIR